MNTIETVEVLKSTEEQGLESVADAVKEGAADATKTAAAVLPGIGKILSKSIYNGCYYISFGVTFSALTVAKLLPVDNTAGRGLHDGAEAAKETITRRAELTEAKSTVAEVDAEQTETEVAASA